MILGVNKIITTYRLENAAGADKTTEYDTDATLTGAEAYIESVRPEQELLIGLKPGLEAHMMYIDPVDIRVTDKVVDQNSKVYYVQGIKRHEDNLDTDDLYEILLYTELVRYND